MATKKKPVKPITVPKALMSMPKIFLDCLAFWNDGVVPLVAETATGCGAGAGVLKPGVAEVELVEFVTFIIV
jgi:hypothetical protein